MEQPMTVSRCQKTPPHEGQAFLTANRTVPSWPKLNSPTQRTSNFPDPEDALNLATLPLLPPLARPDSNHAPLADPAMGGIRPVQLTDRQELPTAPTDGLNTTPH